MTNIFIGDYIFFKGNKLKVVALDESRGKLSIDIISEGDNKIIENPLIIEKWLPVPGFNTNVVSNTGKIKNIKTGLIRKPQVLNGYERIGFSIKGTLNNKSFSVHRLVALLFIPNTKNKEQVNHIDGNKRNNCVTNLEWTTREENIKHAKLLHQKYYILQLTKKTGKLVKRWNTTGEIYRTLNIQPSLIRNVMKGKYKTSRGYRWVKEEL